MKVFPTNALSNSSTYNTDEAKATKVFPTLEEIQKPQQNFSLA